MTRVFLTPFVIAGLLFLPSCSSAEAKACEAAEQANIDFAVQRAFYMNAGNDYAKAQQAETNRARVIVNNSSCFTPQQVAAAQTYISKTE